MRDKKYAYKATIMKKYNLTRHQIEEAIRIGIIKDVKRVKNPHYHSRDATIINEDEVIQHLDEIKSIEKYSKEELERMRVYRARSRRISRISFYCPLCKAKIRPPRSSYTRDAVLRRLVDYEDARIVVIVTHFRHIHTDYDSARRNRLMDYVDRERLKGIKARHYDELEEEALERLKDEKTREAIELAKRASLLPEGFTKEDYDKIATRIKRIYGLG